MLVYVGLAWLLGQAVCAICAWSLGPRWAAWVLGGGFAALMVLAFATSDTDFGLTFLWLSPIAFGVCALGYCAGLLLRGKRYLFGALLLALPLLALGPAAVERVRAQNQLQRVLEFAASHPEVQAYFGMGAVPHVESSQISLEGGGVVQVSFIRRPGYSAIIEVDADPAQSPRLACIVRKNGRSTDCEPWSQARE